MATIATTTNAAPCIYPSTQLLTMGYTGKLYALVKSSTADTYVVYHSIDAGVSWNVLGTVVRTNIVEIGGLKADNYGWLYWVYRLNEAGEDRVCFRRMYIPTGAWTIESFLGGINHGGTPGSQVSGVDIATYYYGGYFWVCVAKGHGTSNAQGMTVHGAHINQNGTLVSNDAVIQGTRKWLTGGASGRSTPQISIEHTGNEIYSSSPNLWISFGRTGLYIVKLAWRGGGWTGPSSYVTAVSSIGATDSIAGRWDTDRFIMVVKDPAVADRVLLVERNRANTVTTLRQNPNAHPTGNIRQCTVAYDPTSRNARVFAIGTSTAVIYYADYVRATDVWSGWSSVSADAVMGANVDNFNVRRSNQVNAHYDVILAVSGSPNTVKNIVLGTNYAPNIPTWAAPNNGDAQNVSASLLLDWDFHDIDPADAQTAYAVSRQIGAGALNYWRASDSTWQVAEVKNTSATTAITIPSSWGSGSDATYTFKVKVWDSTDVASAYSAALMVVPSVVVNPTIVNPPTSPAWTQTNVVATWTVSEQSAYQVQLYDSAGVNQLYDSGWISGADLTFAVPYVLSDLTTYQLKLTTKNLEGLPSAQQSRTFSTDFVEASVPILTVTPNVGTGMINVAIANPSAAGAPATFVNTGAPATGDNASLAPAKPSSVAVGDLLVIFASIRNSGTGSVNLPAGWSDVLTFGNMRVMNRYADGTALDTPTVTFAGGAAGEDTLAQMTAFRGTADRPSVTATLLNASAQNISYPALTITAANQTVLICGWKQDDLTGATDTGTEIGEISSIVGNDASMAWYYIIQTTAANISAGSITITGGAAAISRGVVIALQIKPSALYQSIYRRVVGDVGPGIRIATGVPPNSTYNDISPVSGVAYEYKARVFGANDTSIDSAWTA